MKHTPALIITAALIIATLTAQAGCAAKASSIDLPSSQSPDTTTSTKDIDTAAETIEQAHAAIERESAIVQADTQAKPETRTAGSKIDAIVDKASPELEKIKTANSELIKAQKAWQSRDADFIGAIEAAHAENADLREKLDGQLGSALVWMLIAGGGVIALGVGLLWVGMFKAGVTLISVGGSIMGVAWFLIEWAWLIQWLILAFAIGAVAFLAYQLYINRKALFKAVGNFETVKPLIEQGAAAAGQSMEAVRLNLRLATDTVEHETIRQVRKIVTPPKITASPAAKADTQPADTAAA